MALLEDGNTCCICDERKVHLCLGSIPAYYCAHCFDIHKSDILGSAPWVKMLLNGERQRRKRRNRLLTAGYTLNAVYSEWSGGAAPRTKTHQQVQYVGG